MLRSRDSTGDGDERMLISELSPTEPCATMLLGVPGVPASSIHDGSVSIAAV